MIFGLIYLPCPNHWGSPMTDLDLKELRRLAEAAIESPELQSTWLNGWDLPGFDEEIISFVAAANPTVILELLDRVEKAEVEVETLHGWIFEQSLPEFIPMNNELKPCPLCKGEGGETLIDKMPANEFAELDRRGRTQPSHFPEIWIRIAGNDPAASIHHFRTRPRMGDDRKKHLVKNRSLR